MMIVLCALICWTLFEGGISSKLTRIHVDPTTGYFLDEDDRVRLFHGINSVIKGDPWYDPKLLDRNRQKQLAQLGFNVVRLGAMWTGVEPEEGQINQTYIDILQTLVSDLSDVGIYTILDAHQDVLWQYGNDDNLGGYWGVPPWIKEKLKKPGIVKEFPRPFENITRWVCGYFTEEISTGFGDFYSNENGTVDSFATFWKTLTKSFKSQSSVLGYEILNEPWAGNIYEKLELFFPGIAGMTNLRPLYDKVNSAIRELDETTILFWEPVTWSYFIPYKSNVIIDVIIKTAFSKFKFSDVKFLFDNFCSTNPKPIDLNDILNILKKVCAAVPPIEALTNDIASIVDFSRGDFFPSIFGPGLPNVPGGDDFRNRTVMSWHYYCWAMDQADDNPYPLIIRFFCDEIMGPTIFSTVEMRRSILGGGSMLTEFGLCTPNLNNPNSENSLECIFVLNEADSFFQSWTYWDTSDGFSFWDEDGNLIPEVVAFFARPYPMATDGTPFKLSFDVWTKTFKFQFYPRVTSAKAKLFTEIFVPQIHYPNGNYVVKVSENLKWTISEENENIILVQSGAKASRDKLEFIQIVPKSRRVNKKMKCH